MMTKKKTAKQEIMERFQYAFGYGSLILSVKDGEGIALNMDTIAGILDGYKIKRVWEQFDVDENKVEELKWLYKELKGLSSNNKDGEI